MHPVRVAVPNKGVMADSVLQLLADAGLDPRSHLGPRALEATLGSGFDAVFVAAANIPEFVADGAADVGITGWDLVCESGRRLEMRLDVELAPCRLVLAAPTESDVATVGDVAPGTRVATVFPRLTRGYFAEAGIDAEIVEVSGAVEVTPRLGVADLIVDLVATGSTLRANQLHEVATLLTSSARLVSRPTSEDPPALRERLDELAVALGSVVQARNQRYLMANVPRARLGDVRGILPGAGGPDVVELLDGGELIAVQAVVALDGRLGDDQRASRHRRLGDRGHEDRAVPPVSSQGSVGRTATIAAMRRYQPRRPPTRVDLSDNTSLWGPPPSVRATLAALIGRISSRGTRPRTPTRCARPSPSATASTPHTSSRAAAPTTCSTRRSARAATRGRRSAVAVPTFSVVPSFAEVNEVSVAQVPLRRDGSLDAAALLATGADLYYVCAPNNPTGTGAGDGALRALLAGTTATVLVDEAYADFADHDATGLLDEHRNLVVVRTLSKAYGLAGLRVGYGLGDPDVVGAIAVSRGPYKVGSVAEAVALGVLRDDTAWVDARVGEVRALRGWLTSGLRDGGFEVLESQANFVAVLVDDATALLERLLAAGVLARAYASLPVFGDLLRVTVGPRAQLDEALGLLTGGAR